MTETTPRVGVWDPCENPEHQPKNWRMTDAHRSIAWFSAEKPENHCRCRLGGPIVRNPRSDSLCWPQNLVALVLSLPCCGAVVSAVCVYVHGATSLARRLHALAVRPSAHTHTPRDVGRARGGLSERRLRHVDRTSCCPSPCACTRAQQH